MRSHQIRFLLFLSFIISFALLTQGCKVTKPAKPTPQDTGTGSPDRLKLTDSIDIKVYRLLKDTILIIGVGDIMMGTNYPDPKYLPADSGKSLLQDVTEVLRRGDITFGNLEGVILDEGGTPKKCNNPDLCYLFRSPTYYAANLVEAGFNLMSTANNHAGDFGNEGRENTIKVLDSLGIHHAGLLQQPYTLFRIEGMKFGFAAFSPNDGTLSIHDSIRAREIITHLDSMADIVIVSFHGGAEGKKYQHVIRETELFYGEDRGNVYTFSHHLIDAGADVVFGHGPHVTRAIELYQNRLICYSLGNFCTYARFNLKGENGIAPIVKVFTDHNGQFLKGEIIPIVQTGLGKPEIDPNKRAIIKLQELSQKDFPESKIKIDESGIIIYIAD